MFGQEDDLILYLLALGAVTGLVAAGFAWLVARRVGWKLALLVPLAIGLGAVAMVWRAGGDGHNLIGTAAILAAPGMIGAVIGLLIGARRR